MVGETGIAEGFLDRSIMIYDKSVVEWCFMCAEEKGWSLKKKRERERERDGEK